MSDLARQAAAECRTLAKSDAVNHPAHYTRGGLECIDAIRAATEDLNGIEGYYTGNIIKYMWRWKAKNGVQDLEKAAWYLRALTEYSKAERKADGTK